MAKTKEDETLTPTVEAQIEGQAEMPGWATGTIEPVAGRALEGPAASQWRRKLTAPELMSWVASHVRGGDASDEQMGMEIFAQIAAADSVSDVLSGKVETVKGREILDQIVECDAIKFMASDMTDGCPYFTVLSVRTTKDNSRETISLGGWMTLAQLANIHYMSTELPTGHPYLIAEDKPGAVPMDSYPHYFKIKQKPTPSGHMNYLVPAMA